MCVLHAYAWVALFSIDAYALRTRTRDLSCAIGAEAASRMHNSLSKYAPLPKFEVTRARRDAHAWMGWMGK